MAQSFTLDIVNINNRLLSGAIELTNGQSFSISGIGFGTKVGYSDHLSVSSIYTQNIGTNFGQVGRWSGTNFIGASNRPVVSADGINGKCLYWNGPAINNCLQFYYDAPVERNQVLFSSKWVKHRTTTTSTLGGQWKSDRWQASTNSLSDKPNETYKNTYAIYSPQNKIQVRNNSWVSGSDDKVLYSSDISTISPLLKNKWVRIDTRITLPSEYANNSEYLHEEWIYDPDGVAAPFYINFTNNQAVVQANPYTADASRWNMHLYQNYFGSSGGGDFTGLTHELWHDKVFESVGNDWRVEFSSTSNFTTAPKSFVQPNTLWSDTLIQGVFDAGNLSFGYLHVIKNGSIVKSIPVRVV